MKNSFLISMVISGLAFVATSSQAQISDNDSSASVLASYCAQSSGLPASNYESYCRELAKTIGQLPVVAQHRVFEDKMPVVPGSDEFGDARDASDQARANASSGSAVGQTVDSSDGGSTEATAGNIDSSQQGATQSNDQTGNGNQNSGGKSKNSGGLEALLGFLEDISNFLFGN